MKTYPINEIFYSIQGEGPQVGRPMVFIRYSGCNLKCEFCDTDFSVKTDMRAADIIKEVSRLIASEKIFPPTVPAICHTGGEPLLYLDEQLIEELGGLICSQHLETNGTKEIPVPEAFEAIVISPKTLVPRAMKQYLEDDAYRNGFLKIVWDPTNWEFATVFAEWAKYVYCEKFVQPRTDPQTGDSNVEETVEWLKRHQDWRLSIQVHKIIGVK